MTQRFGGIRWVPSAFSGMDTIDLTVVTMGSQIAPEHWDELERAYRACLPSTCEPSARTSIIRICFLGLS
jgi:hypothetical protein